MNKMFMRFLAAPILLCALFAMAPSEAATLSASPSSVGQGTSITATWSGISTPSSSDWIGLYAPGAANTAYLSYQYTSGTAAGSLALSIPFVTPGSYELRLFANNGYTLLATSNTFTVTASTPTTTLSASPSNVAPAGTVNATWSGISSPSVNDWIGLFVPGAGNNTYTMYVYTHSNQGYGTTSLPIPGNTPNGTYELRLFSYTGALLATSNSFTVGSSPSATIYYIHSDHLNTPRLIDNQTQQVVWRWDNEEPFGANAVNDNPSGLGVFTFNLRLPGQYYDAETNNHYNTFRDYSPDIGRYIQSDPIGLTGGINTYGYVSGDPISGTDPIGKSETKNVVNKLLNKFLKWLWNSPATTLGEACPGAITCDEFQNTSRGGGDQSVTAYCLPAANYPNSETRSPGNPFLVCREACIESLIEKCKCPRPFF